MYAYKRNHIQIHPKHRKLFRGNHAVLIIKKTRQLALHRYGFVRGLDNQITLKYFPLTKSERLVDEYAYTLVVTNPDLLGRVNGQYENTTFELGKTIRKLKRLVGSKNLTIKKAY